MVKFICNKLGHDKDLETFKSEGITIHYKLLNRQQLREALTNKLIEEANEVHGAKTRSDIIAELADVLELIDAICKVWEIPSEIVVQEKEQHYKMRGGFEKGLYIETIEMYENNPKVSHFRKAPDRYPEL